MDLNAILDQYPEETFLKADGFDDAIIGVDEMDMRLIYSVKKVLEILEQQMNPGEAIQYFNYNILGSYPGQDPPIFCMNNF